MMRRGDWLISRYYLAMDFQPQDYPLAEPIFVTNRYGREDLLALLSKDANPPAGLDKCPFFVEIPQQPIVLKPLTDVETVCLIEFQTFYYY